MKNKILIYIIIILFLIIITIVNIFKTEIDITEYIISNKKISDNFNDFKIVQLSDFHSSGYKDTTDEIIEKVKEINPDIIVMTGDMVECKVENIENVKKLISSLVDVAPIFHIDGNHEHLAEILVEGKYRAFIEWMKSLGVTIIKNGYVELVKGDEVINLYGIDLPLDGATGLYANKFQIEENYVEKTLPGPDANEFNILLAHTPLFIKQYNKWGADLVLAGHMHGGIIRIPFIDVGVFSPEKTIFPKYDAGKFKIKNTTMIVNRGIAASSLNLRVFNNPEITIIKLKKDNMY